MRQACPLLACGAAIAALAAPAAAQPTNYDGQLIGERAAGMGGAFTAVADDGSAFFYNPAGLARVRRSGISLAANTYGWFSATEEDAYRDADSSVDIERAGSLTVPNSLVYILPLGEPGGLQHTVALGVVVPASYAWEGAQNTSLEEARFDAFEREDSFDAIDQRTYLAGPAYALSLGDLHLGASLLFAWSSGRTIEQLSSAYASDGFVFKEQVFTASNTSYLGLTGDLGLLWAVAPSWQVGLKAGLPAVRLWSDALVSQHVSVIEAELEDADGNPRAEPLITGAHQDVYRAVGGEVDWKRPLHLSLGAAWQRSDGWAISADLRLYLPIDPFTAVRGTPQRAAAAPGDVWDPEFGADRSFDTTLLDPGRVLVVNGAVGATIPLSPTLRVLTGVFTDRSAMDPAAVDGFFEHVDRYGASLAVQHLDKTTLTVGLTGLYGTGSGYGVDLSRADAPDYRSTITTWSVALFLAGSAPLGDEKPTCEPAKTP